MKTSLYYFQIKQINDYFAIVAVMQQASVKQLITEVIKEWCKVQYLIAKCIVVWNYQAATNGNVQVKYNYLSKFTAHSLSGVYTWCIQAQYLVSVTHGVGVASI